VHHPHRLQALGHHRLHRCHHETPDRRHPLQADRLCQSLRLDKPVYLRTSVVVRN
jgi:hypothetical protein